MRWPRSCCKCHNGFPLHHNSSRRSRSKCFRRLYTRRLSQLRTWRHRTHSHWDCTHFPNRTRPSHLSHLSTRTHTKHCRNRTSRRNIYQSGMQVLCRIRAPSRSCRPRRCQSLQSSSHSTNSRQNTASLQDIVLRLHNYMTRHSFWRRNHNWWHAADRNSSFQNTLYHWNKWATQIQASHTRSPLLAHKCCSICSRMTRKTTALPHTTEENCSTSCCPPCTCRQFLDTPQHRRCIHLECRAFPQRTLET